MAAELPAAYGAVVQADARELAARLAAGDHAAGLDAAMRVAERGVFRLASLAFSRWWASGAPGCEDWPLVGTPGHLSLGHGCSALAFCAKHASGFPDGRIALPATNRLAVAIAAVETACAGQPTRLLRSRRFDLTGAMAGAERPKAKGTRLAAAFEHVLVPLRNRQAHIAGRADPWPDEHPDYPALMAPLVAAAVVELLGHPALEPALAGTMAARLESVSRTPDRARLPLYRFAPDAAGLQAAFFSAPGGLAALPGDDPLLRAAAALPDRELAALRPSFLVRWEREPAQVVPEALFFDLAQGPPRDPLGGRPLP